MSNLAVTNQIYTHVQEMDFNRNDHRKTSTVDIVLIIGGVYM